VHSSHTSVLAPTPSSSLLVPVFRDARVMGWPGAAHAPAVTYLEAAEALTADHSSDAHFAAYSVPEVPHRLTLEGLGLLAAEGGWRMVLLVVDIDGPGHRRSPAWWADEQPKLAALLAAHPGGFVYATRGGYRIVYRLPAAVVVRTTDDKEAWRLFYLRSLLQLVRAFGLVGDPACADVTRLFRLPHATREPGGAPERHETRGDPASLGAWAYQPTTDELPADALAARTLAASAPTWGPVARRLAPPDVTPGDTTGAALEADSQDEARVFQRAVAYLARMEPSLEGAGGDAALWAAALAMVRGFALGPQTAARLLLSEFNPRCRPPWPRRDLERKCRQAADRGQQAWGYLRDKDGGEAGLRSKPSERRPRSASAATSEGEPMAADDQGVAGAEPHARADAGPGPVSAERPRGADSRPCILVDFETGQRTREVEAALAARDDLNLYTRDGRLVCVEAATPGKRRVWRDDAGTPLAQDLSLAALRCLVTDCMRFERWQKEGRGEDAAMVRVPCRAHDDLVRGLHGATGWPLLRDLVGIARAPFLASLGGDLVTASGYHEESGYLLTLPTGLEAVDVPARPTRGQAREALATLKEELFGDFPFATDHDRSVPLAALLTLLARPALGSSNTPAFLFEANTPSSGKTLLADVCAIVGTGAITPKHGFTTDDREMDKTLGGLASEARSIVCFDNVIEPIGGASLDRAITCGGSLSYRLLGQNKTAQAIWRTVVFFTANNATIGGDVGRRLLVCRLESEHERPGLREGFRHKDLKGYATAHRTQLAALGLTVLRAFCQVPEAQQPKVASLGSFEAWARLVAGALVWLGEADPIAAVADERAGGVDLTRAALGALVMRWNDLANAPRAQLRWSRGKGITVKAALEALYPSGNPVEGDGLDELREALEGLTSPAAGKMPGVRQVGGALARFRDRVVDGHRLLGEQDRKGITVWRVEKTRSQGGPVPGPAGSCRVISKQTEDRDTEEGL
jgi:hypothetical protein